MEDAKIASYSKALLIILGTILTVGLVMVYSSSYLYSKEAYGSSTHLVFKQIQYVLLGLAVALTVSFTKITFWLKYSTILNIGMLILFMLTLWSPLGVGAKGAIRWLQLGPIRFQPAEIYKYVVLLQVTYLLNFFSNLEEKKIYTIFIVTFLSLFCLILQPDFGSLLICFAVIAYCAYLSNLSRKLFYGGLLSGAMIGAALLVSQPYRLKRILTFLDPWKNSKGSGFQIVQSYLAFANGSFWGQGLGNSNEKLFYLPEAHNDFIFSVLGEELGFIGVFITALLFMSFCFCIFKIALLVKNDVVSRVVATIGFLITLQVVLNMGVVLGLLPTKGLNLPFISSGGSSMVANSFGIGLIFSALGWYRKSAQSVQPYNNQGQKLSYSSY